MKNRIVLPGQSPASAPSGPLTSATLFQEIDDALTQERLLGFWVRFRLVILLTLAIGIGAVIVYQAMAHFNALHAERLTTVMASAADPAAQNDTGRDLARLARSPFEQFFALGVSTDDAARQTLIRTLTNNVETPDLIRDTVRLNAVQTALMSPNADTAALLNDLQALIDARSPVADIARLEAAVLAAKAGDPARAVDILAPLTETGANAQPSPVREQAMALRALFASDQYRKELEP